MCGDEIHDDLECHSDSLYRAFFQAYLFWASHAGRLQSRLQLQAVRVASSYSADFSALVSNFSGSLMNFAFLAMGDCNLPQIDPVFKMDLKFGFSSRGNEGVVACPSPGGVVMIDVSNMTFISSRHQNK